MAHDNPAGLPPDEGDEPEPELPPDEGGDEPRPGRGRPSKLTPALRGKALELLRQGMSRPAVAGAIRVGASTFAEWIARGEDRDPDRPQNSDFADFAAFAEEVHEAEADFEQSLIQAIQGKATGAGGEWRAAAFLLERRFPGSWSKRVNQQITGEGGGPVEVSIDFSNMSDEDVERVALGQEPQGAADDLGDPPGPSPRRRRA